MKRRYACLWLLAVLAAAFINCSDHPLTPEGMLLQEQKVDEIKVTINGKVSCASCSGSSMIVDVFESEDFMSLLDKPYWYDSIGNFQIEFNASHGSEIVVKVTMSTPKGTLITREERAEVPDEGDETSITMSFRDPEPKK